MSDPDPDPDLAAAARGILQSNLYMTLATADADGVPWATPVYFTAADDGATFYWVSSPDARHSRNLAVRSAVAIVVFDSKVLVGQATALYMAGTAAQVEDRDLAEAAEIYGARGHGGRYFAPDELRGDADLRLYRAAIAEHHLLARAGDPSFGRTVDGRVRVDLSA